MNNNKTIWITGASSGIGEACAYKFAKEKVNLILTATREEKLIEVKEKCIRFGSKCTILTYDLTDLENIDNLTLHTEESI